MNDVRPYLTTGLSYISAQKSSVSSLFSSIAEVRLCKFIEALFSKDKCIVQLAFGHWYIDVRSFFSISIIEAIAVKYTIENTYFL